LTGVGAICTAMPSLIFLPCAGEVAANIKYQSLVEFLRAKTICREWYFI
jgi:hypothetical protein